MDTTFLSEIKKCLSSDMEFEFSLDFQGQVEYVESENTDQFFVFETVLLFLVEKELVPINERTEGIITIESGMVYISYKTCTQVGEDWNDDVWNEGTSEHSVNDLVVE